MSDRAESLLNDILVSEKPTGSDVRAQQIHDSLYKSHEQAAEELLESDFQTGVYAPKGLRWSLARGDNMEEKRLRLKKKYPEGELDTLKKSIVMGFEDDMLIWRESPQLQWKAVEPQGFDKFDIVEAFAPSAESIAAETAMAIGTGGGTVPATVARLALGAFAGEAVEQGMQAVTGVQAQEPLGVLGESLQEGSFSALGGMAMSPFAGIYNAARGAGALRVGDEGLETMRAAEELSHELLKKLTPGLVTDNPAIRLSEKQSAALLPRLNRRYRDLISMTDAAVRSAAPGNAANAGDAAVLALNDLSDDFLRQLPVVGTRASEGGTAIQAGIKTYGEETYKVVSKLYDNARAIQEPNFDLKPVFELTNDLRRGAKGKFSDKVDTAIKELGSIDGPITLNDGSILSVTDQIRNVRTSLNDIAHVSPGERFTQQNGQAADLAKALTEALENPTNTNAAFVQAWKAANNAAHIRLTTLGKAPIVAAAKSETPSSLVKTYLRPGNYENLLAIRKTVPQRQWREFVDAGYSELLLDPKNLSKNLKAFDQETLDVFMPRADQVVFRNIAKELDRIGAIGVDEIAERQIINRNVIDKIIVSADQRAVKTLKAATRGGAVARQRRRDIQAGIVEWAWDGVVESTKNGLQVNRPLLKSHIKQLKKSGMWELLSPAERNIIGNANIVARAFQSVQDAGTSIMAASTVQGIQRLQSSAIYTALRLGIIGQLYTSPFGRKMLIGHGLPNSTAPFLRAFGGALTQMSAPNDISDLVEEE